MGMILALAAGAVVPQKWTFRSFDEFLRGKFDGLSISSDGGLTLAPREEKIDGPAEDFFLSFLMTAEGVAYLGTGHDGKVFRLTKEGKSELFAQTPEMDVTALTMDKKGVLYAGTSPNGKIYKIAAAGKLEDFFNPDERYIWALRFDEDGRLLAAVGEAGGIYSIGPQGDGRMIFKARENHVLCMTLDRNRDIIAGSGGIGLVYRVTRTGKAAVIFESPYEEVRSLAFDLDGNLYAAAGGTAKARREDVVLPASGRDTDVTITVTAPAAPSAGQTSSPQTKPPAAAPSAGREPGALFRIAPDGIAKRLWASSDELVYSLYWNEPEKQVYFGTGPKGRIYALDKNEKATLVAQKESEQIYALEPVGVRLYVVADNPCQLSVITPEQRLDGQYLSPVLDAKIVAGWGRIGWEVQSPPQATCQFQTRTGNSAEPGPGWSDWSPTYQKADGEQILSPKGRYLQFRALFKTVSAKASPRLSKVNLFFLQTNVAPTIARFDGLAPNEVFLKLPGQDEVILGAERRSPDPVSKKDDGLALLMSKRAERKGWQTLQWEADDDNGDTLTYTLSIKLDEDKDWRVLEEGWTETTYAFNTVNYPDGVYMIKLTASDGASNPRGQDLKSEKVTAPLVIDNTAPEVKAVVATREGNQLSLSFVAEDKFSPIKDAKYLIRPDDWRVVFPEDGICDSKLESFKFKVGLDPTSDRMVTILVKDACGNSAIVKQLF
jgi:sugar lactone lactonase YvrE